MTASQSATFDFPTRASVLQSPCMAVRFFKKLSPGTRVAISQGPQIEFKTLDGIVGYFSTDSDYVASEFEKAMRENRYGITEITWAEYESNYLVKKNSGAASRPVWREEITRGRVMPSVSDLTQRLNEAQAVVGVVNPPPRPSMTISAPAAINQPIINTEIAKALPTVEDYKPEVGKRRKAAKP